MQLVRCKPDLNSRQMLWGLVSELDDLRRTLSEICIVDTVLFNNIHYNIARTKIVEAASEINQLRRFSTLSPLGELSETITDISTLIDKF